MTTPVAMMARASLALNRAPRGVSMRHGVCAMALAVMIGTTACETTVRTHGYAPRANELEEIAAGRDTRGSVLRKLGRPTTVGTFESTIWYYVHTKTEQSAFFEPEVIDRKVVAVRFGQTGAVTDVARYGLEDGKVVDLITKTTPTYGRELSFLQQIFGNLGRIDSGTIIGNE
jgi:outer membrane protein assembly factor BamE (lipoprotein component of BamABCDE complex)